jgi:hypothetical protein
MSSKPAISPDNLLDELQTTLAHGTVARRVETLRRVTDLFISGAVDYSEEQVGLFDDVFQCLIDHIETSAKTLLANRLAPIDTAPPLTIRALAFDDVIEVAGPVLSLSARLDDKTLIENARSKSQAHLMAISTRKVLSGAVTDVLVQRGNDEVIQSTVNNPGAEFTERGFTRLVDRADCDDNLATCVGLRPNMPRHLYLKLLAKASDIVRQRLEAPPPCCPAACSSAPSTPARTSSPGGTGSATTTPPPPPRATTRSMPGGRGWASATAVAAGSRRPGHGCSRPTTRRPAPAARPGPAAPGSSPRTTRATRPCSPGWTSTHSRTT